MRKMRTMLLLALTVGVMGVFAAPALADDAVWTHEGLPIGEGESHDIELTGTLGLTKAGFLTGFCEVDGQATVFTDEAEMTSLSLSNCKTYSTCPHSKGIILGLPSSWSMHPEWDSGKQEGIVKINDLAFVIPLASPCFGNFVFATDGELTARLGNQSADIETLNLSGHWSDAGGSTGSLWGNWTVTGLEGENIQVGVAEA